MSAKLRPQDAVPAGTSPRYPLNKGLVGQEADVDALEGEGGGGTSNHVSAISPPAV